MLSEKSLQTIAGHESDQRSNIATHNIITDDPLRRAIDILIPLFSLLILGLPLCIIALWIKIDSSGPVLHRALRSGKNGELFELYKFRSMVVDADKEGPGITSAGDSRITKSGKFLRRTKLDELPQLFNVLLGDMSLVGPRPEDPRYVALYTSAQQVVLYAKPGITSAASLTYRNEEELLSQKNWEEIYRNQIMPEKLAIDIDYLSKRTLFTDLRLILQTIGSMFV